MHQNELKAIGKCRGRAKAYEEVYSRVDSVGGIDYSKPFAMGYTGESSEFTQFETECRERLFKNQDPIVSIIGVVIGTHIGPGAVAVAFFEKR
jgi:fatty acid-binding protein DegV